MKSSKHTLSILATAAAVTFGGATIAQTIGSDSNASGSATTEQSTASNQDNGLLGGLFGSDNNQEMQANSGNMDAESSGTVDTQTMGNNAGGTASDSSLSADAQADSGADMRAPQVDRN